MEAKNMGLTKEMDKIIAQYFIGKTTYEKTIEKLWNIYNK
jgi:hypothetical protein